MLDIQDTTQVVFERYQRLNAGEAYQALEKEYRQLGEQLGEFQHGKYAVQIIPGVSVGVGAGINAGPIGVSASVGADFTQTLRGAVTWVSAYDRHQLQRKRQVVAEKLIVLEAKHRKEALKGVSSASLEGQTVRASFALLQESDLMNRGGVKAAIESANLEGRMYSKKVGDYRYSQLAESIKQAAIQNDQLLKGQIEGNRLTRQTFDAVEQGRVEMRAGFQKVHAEVMAEGVSTREAVNKAKESIRGDVKKIGANIDDFRDEAVLALAENKDKLNAVLQFQDEQREQQIKQAKQQQKQAGFEKTMRDIEGVGSAFGFLGELGRLTGSDRLQKIAAVGELGVKVASAVNLLSLPAYSGLAALGPVGMIAGTGLAVFSLFMNEDTKDPNAIILEQLDIINGRLDVLDQKLDHLQSTVEIGFQGIFHSFHNLMDYLHYSLTMPVMGKLQNIQADIDLLLEISKHMGRKLMLADLDHALMETRSFWEINARTGEAKSLLEDNPTKKEKYEDVVKLLAHWATEKSKDPLLTGRSFQMINYQQTIKILSQTAYHPDQLESLLGFFVGRDRELQRVCPEHKPFLTGEELAHPRIWMDAVIAYAKMTLLGKEVYGKELPYEEDIEGLQKEGLRIKAFMRHLQVDANYDCRLREIFDGMVAFHDFISTQYDLIKEESILEFRKNAPGMLKYPSSRVGKSRSCVKGCKEVVLDLDFEKKPEDHVLEYKHYDLGLKLPPHLFSYADNLKIEHDGKVKKTKYDFFSNQYIFKDFFPEIILFAFHLGLIKFEINTSGAIRSSWRSLSTGLFTSRSYLVWEDKGGAETFSLVFLSTNEADKVSGNCRTNDELPKFMEGHQSFREMEFLAAATPKGTEGEKIPVFVFKRMNRRLFGDYCGELRLPLRQKKHDELVEMLNKTWVLLRKKHHKKLLDKLRNNPLYDKLHADLSALIAQMKLAGFPEETIEGLLDLQKIMNFPVHFNQYIASDEITVDTSMPIIQYFSEYDSLLRLGGGSFAGVSLPGVVDFNLLAKNETFRRAYFKSYSEARVNQGFAWLQILGMRDALNEVPGTQQGWWAVLYNMFFGLKKEVPGQASVQEVPPEKEKRFNAGGRRELSLGKLVYEATSVASRPQPFLYEGAWECVKKGQQLECSNVDNSTVRVVNRLDNSMPWSEIGGDNYQHCEITHEGATETVKHCVGEQTEYVEYAKHAAVEPSWSSAVGYGALSGAGMAAIPEAIGDGLVLSGYCSARTAGYVKKTMTTGAALAMGGWVSATANRGTVFLAKRAGFSDQHASIAGNTAGFFVTVVRNASPVGLASVAASYAGGWAGMWLEKKAVGQLQYRLAGTPLFA